MAASSAESLESPATRTATKAAEKELASKESEYYLEEREVEKEQEMPAPIKKRRKTTVSPSDFVEELIYEAAVKAVEQDHSRAIIDFERAEKRRQQQFLRDEAAAADAIQREAARRQHIVGHYSLRSSPIAAITFETSNFFQALVFPSYQILV